MWERVLSGEAAKRVRGTVAPHRGPRSSYFPPPDALLASLSMLHPPHKKEGKEGATLGKISILTVRRRASVVSNHEAAMC